MNTTTLYTEPCEAIVNTHPRVYRSALVGCGPAGRQTPALVVECWPRSKSQQGSDRDLDLRGEIHALAQSHPTTSLIERQHIFFQRRLPTDIRHNAKIRREELALWACRQIRHRGESTTQGP